MAELLVYDALMLSFYFEVLRGKQREGTASDQKAGPRQTSSSVVTMTPEGDGTELGRRGSCIV